MKLVPVRNSAMPAVKRSAGRLLVMLAVQLASAVAADAQSKLVLAANGSRIFDTPLAPTLLRQCSRDAPSSVSGYWVPAQAQVTAFERALMRKDAEAMMTQKNVPQKSYDRQYTGMIVNKKKLIYGNFFPSSAVAEMAGLAKPVVACDGGAQFWGATYDPQSDRIVALDANGSY